MATRTISNSGGNYNSTSTWVEGIVPTAADDVVATGTSGNLTVVGVVGYCKSINLTGYTATLAINITLLVSGNITLSSSMTITGTTYININANSSITSNGKAIPYLAFSLNNVVITLVDNMYISNLLLFQSGYNVVMNNNNVYCTKDVTHISFAKVSGTTNIIMSGTGIFSGISPFDTIYNPFIINSPSGSITIQGEMAIGKSLTYITGSITMSGNTYLYLRGATGSMDVSFAPNKKWYYISIVPTQTINILTDLYTDTLSLSRPVLTGNNIYVYKDLYSLGPSGTTKIIIAGSGSWFGADSFYYLGNDLIINTTSSFKFAGPYLNYNSAKMTYISGNVTFPSPPSVSSSLFVTGNTTFDTSGMTFNEITFASGVTTLSSSLNATTMSLGPSEITFTGSAGFNTKILSVVSSSVTARFINLTPGITYNVSEKFNSTGSAGVNIVFRASSSAFRPYFNLALTGSQDVRYTNATNIDSSGGQMIFSIGGTLINSINWSNYPSNFFLLFE